MVRDVPAPPCPPGSLLIRNAYSVISSGTERTRVELSQKSLLGKARERPDLVRQALERAKREGIRATREAVARKLTEETPVGYSSAGHVIEVGAGVRGFDVGDAVACAGGGHANHAEIVSVPVNLCAHVPDGVPLESAAMTTIAAIALHGLRLAEVSLGDKVAVVGCGLVGRIASRLLNASGAEVFALDVDADRVDLVVADGARHGFLAGPAGKAAVLAATEGVGVDRAVVTAGASSSDPLVLAAELLRDRGALVLVGGVPVQIPRSVMYDKEISFRVSRSYGPGRYDVDYEERGLDYPIGYVRWTEKRNMEAVLELQARGSLTLVDLVEEIVPVDDASDAYERLVGEGAVRPRGALVIAYGEEPGSRTSIASSLAIDAPPATPAKAATSRPLRVGLIGAGSFASRILVPALTAAGARLELVGGGSGPSAEAAVRTLGFGRAAESAEAVIDDESVDAVVIATRHSTHAELVIRALEAGKHVFCEKPLALSFESLEEVVAAAAAAPGILAVGFNRRFSPLLRDVKSFVGGGAGQIAATYRVNAGRVPPEHWVHDLEQGGGRALGEGCHFVDCLAYLTGSRIETVYATGYGAPDLPVQARDNFLASLTFADGSVGEIVYVSDGSGRVPKERLEAFSGPRTAILDDYLTVDLFGPTSTERRKARTQDKGHREEIAAFVRGAELGEPPVPLTEVTNVSLATIAIVESLRTGSPVRLD